MAAYGFSTALLVRCMCVGASPLLSSIYSSSYINSTESTPTATAGARPPAVLCTALLYHARTFDVDRSARAPTGSLHEHIVHERLKAYVCVLYDSPCVSLLLPGLGNSTF